LRELKLLTPNIKLNFISALLFTLFFIQGEALNARALVELPTDAETIVHYGADSAKSFQIDKPLRIAVWNVHKLADDVSLTDIKYFSYLSDLTLLQESMMGNEFADYFNDYSNYGWFGAISFLDRSAKGTGVSTGSRVQPEYEAFVRSEVREPILGSPKMILITKYLVGGAADKASKELLVANIHGINFVGLYSYQKQIDQLVAAVRAHQGPMIVAGDFNTHMPARRKILEKMAVDLKLDHVVLDNQRSGRLILDHIFERGLDKITAGVRYDIDSSDHYPLYAQFLFQR
jgi:endonuclease/exonuclease/phosphatase (EEP) superfamily protein YafD